MSVGEGIFYGLVFLGLIYLYIQTRDRWNWKKIVLRIFLGIAAFIAVVVIYNYAEGLIQKIEIFPVKPVPVTTLNDITIGEKVGDVQFRTGAKVKSKDENQSYVLPNQTNVFFQVDKSGLVDRVGNWCSPDALQYPYLNSPVINDIRCGDSSDKVLEKFGGKRNFRVLCLKKAIGDIQPESARAYDALPYGVRFMLVTNKVSGMYIYKPEDLKEQDMSERWSECN